MFNPRGPLISSDCSSDQSRSPSTRHSACSNPAAPAHSARHPAAVLVEHTACTAVLPTPDLAALALHRSRPVVRLQVAMARARRYLAVVVAVQSALVAVRCPEEGCKIGTAGAGKELGRAKRSDYAPRSPLGSIPSSCMCWRSGGCWVRWESRIRKWQAPGRHRCSGVG